MRIFVKTWSGCSCDKKVGNGKLFGSATGEADNDGRRTPLDKSTLVKTNNDTIGQNHRCKKITMTPLDKITLVKTNNDTTGQNHLCCKNTQPI